MASSQRTGRHEMPTSVRQALRDLRRVPKPDSDAWAANRLAFLEQAREMRAGAVAPTPGTTSWRERRRFPWLTLRRFALRDFSPVAVALKAAIVLALLMGGSVTTVSAARNSLPGSVLYGLKLQLEDWEMGRADTPEKAALTALYQADERVSEATRLQGRGWPVPEETSDRYSAQLQQALLSAGEIGAAEQEGAEAQIEVSLGRQLRLMEQTAAEVIGGEGPDWVDPGVQAMIQTMREAQASFGPGEPPIEVGSPGNGPRPSGTEEADEAPADDRPATAPADVPTRYGEQDLGRGWLWPWDLEPDDGTLPSDGGAPPDPDGAPGPGPGSGPDNGDAPGSTDGDEAPGPGPGGSDEPDSGPRGQVDTGRS